jgi:acetamidase/formamidase
MKTVSLVVLSIWLALESASAQAGGTVHHLAPTPQTVAWGSFDPHRAPVLRIKSGDTVEVETLIAGDVERLELAGVPADQIQPALRDIDREVKERHGPHILTGPIFIEGAEAGDVLEIRIKSIDLAIPYAVNIFRPGAGLLTNEFPYARFKVTPLDAARKVARFADGIEIPIQPFFGVMGVAPPGPTGLISSGPPWVHGGNMDNKALVAGPRSTCRSTPRGRCLRWATGTRAWETARCVSALWRLRSRARSNSWCARI